MSQQSRRTQSQAAHKKSGRPARASRDKRPTLGLVAVELGSGFPSWVSNSASSGQFRVVSQRDAEPTEAFHQRICALSQELLAGPSGLSSAILVCNERTDPGMLLARRDLIRRLATPSSSANAPGIVLAAGAHSSARLRQALFDLTSDLAGSYATVRIDAEPASRPHASLHSVANVA